MFIYENHTGGFFVSEKELSGEERYCGACEDEDVLVGDADNRKEAFKLMEPFEYHCQSYKDIEYFVNKNWPKKQKKNQAICSDRKQRLLDMPENLKNN